MRSVVATPEPASRMLVLTIALAVTILDQVTKQVVRWDFFLGESRPVVDGFFNLTYVRNTGAAWGMLGGQNTWLSLLSVLMLVLLVVYRRSLLGSDTVHRVALGLMVGGILGNLFDRLRLEWVTDFLDFYVGTHHWPVFNIADSAICTGVALYLFCSLRAKRQHGATSPAVPTA